MEELSHNMFDWDFANKVQKMAGNSINLCFQCKKCTSGCPIVFQMDYSPAQIIYAARLGMKDLVLNSDSIWLCASCETCTTRCPQDVDIAKVMDAGRILARKEKLRAGVREIAVFNKTFLQNIRIFGRLYEAGLTVFLKLRTGEIKKDLDLGITMLKKGKLKLFPSFTRVFEINRMFSRIKKLEHKRI